MSCEPRAEAGGYGDEMLELLSAEPLLLLLLLRVVRPPSLSSDNNNPAPRTNTSKDSSRFLVLFSEPLGPFLFVFSFGAGGQRGWFLPPFSSLFLHGRFAPCFWYLGLFFPPSLRAGFGLCFAFFAPLFSVVASASYQVGPTSSLGDKSGPDVMSLVSNVMPFFGSMACLVINSIVRFFRLFHLVGLLSLFPLMLLGR
jgi:hypothetical protein